MVAYVYRLKDAEGALLYVGHTKNIHRRIIEHQGQAAWWPSVVDVDIRTFNTIDAARHAEAEAIRYERPSLNYNLKNPADRQQRRRPRGGPVVNGAALRAVRVSKGVTVSALAAAAGIRQPHLSNIEAGRRKASRDVIVAIAENLGVDVRAITNDVAA